MKTLLKLKKNPKLWEKYFLREKIIQTIREFFIEKKFHEVETPLLVPSVIPESYLDVFKTYLLDRKRQKKWMFLTTSPEASIKKLLVAGIGNCFEITKSFRNSETGSTLHNPEFTILEWYRISATYKDIMKDCEDLVMYIYQKIKNQILVPSKVEGSKIKDTRLRQGFGGQANKNSKRDKINYLGNFIDLTPSWERISVTEAFKKYASISFDEITEKIDNEKEMFPLEKIAKIAEKKGYKVEPNNTWEEIFNQIFLNEIEPHLGTHGKPTIIYDFPRPMAALAKIKDDDPRLTERFELYIGGLEIGDCYTELTDYEEQRKRFVSEMEIIHKKKKISIIPDEDFLEALKIGLPKCSGIAVGVDRLVMLFTNSSKINDTLLFPLNNCIPFLLRFAARESKKRIRMVHTEKTSYKPEFF